jgi:hypothetical protein
MTDKSKSENKDAVSAIVLLLLIIQWRLQWSYGLPAIMAFITLALLFKNFTKACSKCWFWLAKSLNAISSFILLTIVYIFIVIPTGLFSRLFKKSAVNFKSVKPQSNFISINKQYSNLDFLKPW